MCHALVISSFVLLPANRNTRRRVHLKELVQARFDMSPLFAAKEAIAAMVQKPVDVSAKTNHYEKKRYANNWPLLLRLPNFRGGCPLVM